MQKAPSSRTRIKDSKESYMYKETFKVTHTHITHSNESFANHYTQKHFLTGKIPLKSIKANNEEKTRVKKRT